MIRDLGTVRPGTTLYIPFHTFDSNDPSASVTLSGLATTDIEIYKDGSVTQRASDSGYALLDTDGIDFDGITGIHGFSIDLADNTTAGFYAAGSQYWVVVSSVTVDAATINFVAATFRIGEPNAVLNTTIATLSTQTSFTLTAGPAEDDALNGWIVVIHDVASAVQMGHAVVQDYTGGTKTVTLTAGTTFTAAATDNISFFPPSNAQYLRSDPQSAEDLKDFADAGYDPGTNKVQGVVLVDTLTTYTGNTVQTGDGYAIVNSGTFGNAAIKTQTAAIETDTAEIGVAGAGLTNINLPNQTMDIIGNITGNLSGSVGSVTGAVGSVTATVSADVVSISGDTTAADNLETMLDGTGGQTLSLGRLVATSAGAAATIAVSNTNAGSFPAIALTSSNGIGLTATGAGGGVTFTGTTGYGLRCIGATGASFLGTGGYGLELNAAGFANAGLSVASDAGPAAYFQAGSTNNYGIEIYGAGTEAGLYVKGGATGPGFEIVGGDTSGKGIFVTTTDGHAFELDANGSSKVSINAPDGITANITGNITGTLATVTTLTNLPAITANWLTAEGTAADFTTEIQSGLATAAAVSTLQTSVDDLPTSAELATALGTADDAVLTQIALVKAKTDLLPEGPTKNATFTYVIKMVDATDGITPETGLTVTMTRSLDGAAFGAATGTVAEISTGHYKVDASAADMNGDVVAHRFTATGARDFTQVIQTTA